MSDATGQRPPGTDGLGGFEDTVKDFWVSRPRRPVHGRKVAGVAVGFGHRYGIDPVVVRVALVVTTVLGGVGVAVYLLGWLFLPDERDEVSAFEGMIGRGRTSSSKTLACVLCLALIPTLPWTFAGSWFNGGGFIGLGLVAAAVYLLHRSRGQYNRPSTTPREPTGFASAAFTSSDVAEDGAVRATEHDARSAPGSTAPEEESAPQRRAGPSGWDPLGAAPLAWDLPTPPAAHTPPAHTPPADTPPAKPGRTPARGRKSKVGVATFGAALVVAGVGAGLAGSGTAWFSVQHVIGLVLAVVGAGLVTASFLGGGRGLIGLAVPLAVAGIVATAVPFDRMPGGVGAIQQNPTNAEELEPSYERAMGEVDLDLTELPPTATAATSIHVGMGQVTVRVPAEVDVRYTCSSGAGNVECLDRTREGLGNDTLSGRDNGVNGRDQGLITLDATIGMGNLEIRRA